MSRAIILLLISLALPANAVAAVPATFAGSNALLVASSSPSNAYLGGASVTVTAPTRGDLSVVAGSVVVASPVSGDALVAAGSASLRDTVAGDVRAIGGSIAVDGPIKGDLVAFGGSVQDSSSVGGSVFLGGATVSLTGGASGPVLIYGNTITLGGNFAGNVRVVSTGHVTLAENTHIAGTLSYEAPETALVPDTAVVDGGVTYTSVSYLPTKNDTRTIALLGVGIFLLVKIVGALILAGLVAGLFPKLAETVTEQALTRSRRRQLLLFFLGFALLVATPILLLLLSLTFIGLGLALVLFLAYCLLAIMSVVYAGITIGALIARRFERRRTSLWRDGVLGMLILALISLIPFIGLSVLFILIAFTEGILATLIFRFAFPHDSLTEEML